MHSAHTTRKRERSSSSEHSVPLTSPFKRRKDGGYLEAGGIASTPQASSTRGTLHSLQSREIASTNPISVGLPPTSGILSHANNMVLQNPNFHNVEHLVQTVDSGSFMEKFVRYTLPGAAYDSSSRDPPPRCHPGTRLTSLRRAQDFLDAPGHHKRLFWIVGPAGVGKSAIMQSIAESIPGLKVSIFFSANVRDDPAKVFPTLAFQIATEHTQYHNYIQKGLVRDPTIPQTSLETQFRRFVVEPFLTSAIFTEPHPLPILIDGLDECRDTASQCRLLSIIAKFISQHPSSPFTWIIASRPEPHITAFFDHPEHVGLYVKEEIPIDTNEACADVERCLRAEFERIRWNHVALRFLHQWPNEKDFLLIAAAAKGLFAYSSAATKFIDDPNYSNPESQLQILLSVINRAERRHEGNINPMAQLHTLYDHIVDRIPSEYCPTATKIFAQLVYGYFKPFANMCDWLGICHTDAYGSLRGLHSVLDIPQPEFAEQNILKSYHKSFMDYLENKFESCCPEGCREQVLSCSVRVLNQIPEDVGNVEDARGRIELFWPYQDKDSMARAQRILHERASRTLLNDLGKTREFVRNDVTLVHCLKVVHPGAAYQGLQCQSYGDKYISHLSLLPDNHFLVPIEQLTSKYYKNTTHLMLYLYSKDPLIKEQHKNLECGLSEDAFAWEDQDQLDDEGLYCVYRYMDPDDNPDEGSCVVCVQHLQEILDLVRKESPAHQVILLTGLELDGTAAVLGQVIHPRDENVEIEFAWLNDPQYFESSQSDGSEEACASDEPSESSDVDD